MLETLIDLKGRWLSLVREASSTCGFLRLNRSIAAVRHLKEGRGFLDRRRVLSDLIDIATADVLKVSSTISLIVKNSPVR